MGGIYLYAIMAGGYQLDLGRFGLPDGMVRVYTLPVNGLSAVVGEYGGPAFGDLKKADLLRSLAIHQSVIEGAMSHRPVLPVKFGTVLTSEEETRCLIDQWQGRLAAAFGELGDTVEIEVAVTWQFNEVLAEIARQPEIVKLTATTIGLTVEQTVPTRIEVGRLIKEALDSRREVFRGQLLDDLRAFARAAQPNPLPSDEFVSNIAFLIERSHLDAFYACVNGLDEKFGGRLNFRCVGPLPPYSFGTVEIQRPDANEIDAARQLLQLGRWISESELASSYRRLAASCHPDRNPDDPTTQERFTAVTAAHAKLLAYVRGQRRGETEGEQSRWYDLSRPAVESALFLNIKRATSWISPLGESVYGRQNA